MGLLHASIFVTFELGIFIHLICADCKLDIIFYQFACSLCYVFDLGSLHMSRKNGD